MVATRKTAKEKGVACVTCEVSDNAHDLASLVEKEVLEPDWARMRISFYLRSLSQTWVDSVCLLQHVTSRKENTHQKDNDGQSGQVLRSPSIFARPREWQHVFNFPAFFSDRKVLFNFFSWWGTSAGKRYGGGRKVVTVFQGPCSFLMGIFVGLRRCRLGW